jgi:hypothetical protein
MHNVLGKLG